jgi:hypothetical protein
LIENIGDIQDNDYEIYPIHGTTHINFSSDFFVSVGAKYNLWMSLLGYARVLFVGQGKNGLFNNTRNLK